MCHVNLTWPGGHPHIPGILSSYILFISIFPEPPNGVLGDSGYACKTYLLTPYIDPELPHQINNNKAHCQTRVRIEQSFGIIKNRFPCPKFLRVTPERAIVIISATFVLHDIACLRNEIRFENLDNFVVPDLEVKNVHNNDDDFLQTKENYYIKFASNKYKGHKHWQFVCI